MSSDDDLLSFLRFRFKLLRVRGRDGRRRLIKWPVFLASPGRPEHSEHSGARRHQALDHAATLIADFCLEYGPGDPDLFDWQDAFDYVRGKLGEDKRPGNMLVVAAAKALRVKRPKGAGIKRQMADYWKNRKGFDEAVQWIRGLALACAKGDFIQPSQPRSSGASA